MDYSNKQTNYPVILEKSHMPCLLMLPQMSLLL